MTWMANGLSSRSAVHKSVSFQSIGRWRNWIVQKRSVKHANSKEEEWWKDGQRQAGAGREEYEAHLHRANSGDCDRQKSIAAIKIALAYRDGYASVQCASSALSDGQSVLSSLFSLSTTTVWLLLLLVRLSLAVYISISLLPLSADLNNATAVPPRVSVWFVIAEWFWWRLDCLS